MLGQVWKGLDKSQPTRTVQCGRCLAEKGGRIAKQQLHAGSRWADLRERTWQMVVLEGGPK